MRNMNPMPMSSLQVFVALLVVSRGSNFVSAMRRIPTSSVQSNFEVPRVRGSAKPVNMQAQRRRRAAPMMSSSGGGGGSGSGGGGSGGGSSYLGCLNYTGEELEEMWIFADEAPNCTYFHHGNSSYYGEGEYYGDDDGAGGYPGDDDAAYDQDDDYDRNGNGNGNGNGEDGDYVVSNEDVGDGNNGDPIESFDISDCSTYDNLWLWDLALTCDSDTSLANCECTFTEELMELGRVTCSDIENCPAECPVCETCFKMLGCTKNGGVLGKTKISASTLIAILAAIGLFLFGIIYYYSKHRNGYDENSLEAHLIDKKGPASDKQGIADRNEGFAYELEEPSVAGGIPNFRSDASSIESDNPTVQSATSSSGHDGYDYSLSADGGDMSLMKRAARAESGSVYIDDSSHGQSTLPSVPSLPSSKVSLLNTVTVGSLNYVPPPANSNTSLDRAESSLDVKGSEDIVKPTEKSTAGRSPSEALADKGSDISTDSEMETNNSTSAENSPVDNSSTTNALTAVGAVSAASTGKLDRTNTDDQLSATENQDKSFATAKDPERETPGAVEPTQEPISTVQVNSMPEKKDFTSSEEPKSEQTGPKIKSEQHKTSSEEKKDETQEISELADVPSCATDSFESAVGYPNPWLDSSSLPKGADAPDDEIESMKSFVSLDESFTDAWEPPSDEEDKEPAVPPPMDAQEKEKEQEQDEQNDKDITQGDEPKTGATGPPEDTKKAITATTDTKATAIKSDPPAVWLAPLDDCENMSATSEQKDDVAGRPNTTEEASCKASAVWLAPSTSEADLLGQEDEDASSEASSYKSDKYKNGPWLAPV